MPIIKLINKRLDDISERFESAENESSKKELGEFSFE